MREAGRPPKGGEPLTDPEPRQRNRVRILDVRLTVQRFDAAIERLLAAASGPRSRPYRAHFCNVHTIVEAQSSRRLREAYESADMVAMDGAPLVAVSRFRGRVGDRVTGPDVLLKLCDLGRQSGLRHYFFGGQPNVPAALASSLKIRFPGLIVAGHESPPFRPVTAEEDAAQVARINAAHPDILWVGLGAPKQEFWAADHQDRLSVGLILPVGAAFDFYSGRIRRAPRWMQRIGLEWLFRMLADPRRLVRRYAVTNTKFGWAILREELGRRRTER